jgi:hypothetical protein
LLDNLTGDALALGRAWPTGAPGPDQPFDRGAIAGQHGTLDRIPLRDTSAGTGHVGEVMNSEWVTFANKQRAVIVQHARDVGRVDGLEDLGRDADER